ISQQRALELLRQAAAALQRGNSTTTTTSNTDTATTANTSQSATFTSRTMAAVRNIFAPYQPYSVNRTGARARRFNHTQARTCSFWTHKFCVLGKTSDDDDGIQEECIRYHRMIPLRLLREHAMTCGVTEEDEVLTFSQEEKSYTDTSVPICLKETEPGVCPVCDKIVPIELLPEHADVCCQSDEVCHSFDDYLSSKTLNGEKLWDISVIRRMLVQQAMEEIEQASEEEWNRKFCITFIGEEDLDSGGLTREFLTLLYDQSPVFENSVLSFDA
ncbi:hypothetical protein MAR_021508, partial [Mya arenaria]